MGEQLTLPGPYLAGWQQRTTTVTARAQIAELRATGLGPTAIARRLTAAAVSTPTGRGGWRPETVLRVEDPAGWAAYMRRYRARQRVGQHDPPLRRG